MFGLIVWGLIKKDAEHCKFKNQEKNNKNQILPYMFFKIKRDYLWRLLFLNIIFSKITKYFKLLVLLPNFNIFFLLE